MSGCLISLLKGFKDFHLRILFQHSHVASASGHKRVRKGFIKLYKGEKRYWVSNSPTKTPEGVRGHLAEASLLQIIKDIIEQLAFDLSV